MKKNGFFETASGDKSSTRLMTFMALCVGLIIALSAVFGSEITLGDALPFTVTLLGYSLGAKAFQNAMDMKK